MSESHHESQTEIAELKIKLAKAVSLIGAAERMLKGGGDPKIRIANAMQLLSRWRNRGR